MNTICNHILIEFQPTTAPTPPAPVVPPTPQQQQPHHTMMTPSPMQAVQPIQPASTPITPGSATVIHGIPGAPGIAGAPPPGMQQAMAHNGAAMQVCLSSNLAFCAKTWTIKSNEPTCTSQ